MSFYYETDENDVNSTGTYAFPDSFSSDERSSNEDLVPYDENGRPIRTSMSSNGSLSFGKRIRSLQNDDDDNENSRPPEQQRESISAAISGAMGEELVPPPPETGGNDGLSPEQVRILTELYGMDPATMEGSTRAPASDPDTGALDDVPMTAPDELTNFRFPSRTSNAISAIRRLFLPSSEERPVSPLEPPPPATTTTNRDWTAAIFGPLIYLARLTAPRPQQPWWLWCGCCLFWSMIAVGLLSAVAFLAFYAVRIFARWRGWEDWLMDVIESLSAKYRNFLSGFEEPTPWYFTNFNDPPEVEDRSHLVLLTSAELPPSATTDEVRSSSSSSSSPPLSPSPASTPPPGDDGEASDDVPAPPYEHGVGGQDLHLLPPRGDPDG
ncbi:hypothetical protein PG993_003807 [Apiospora rasikravindrae]|uniref:Uncharacterized protein n=1 Tax=Apiospora rasikravindrae TaxID=990691 RepID=A0ABR1U0J9_9PEZI